VLPRRLAGLLSSSSRVDEAPGVASPATVELKSLRVPMERVVEERRTEGRLEFDGRPVREKMSSK
jgi:hypothetical protein